MRTLVFSKFFKSARFGYRAWLYVQVSSGDLITRDMLSWRAEIEA